METTLTPAAPTDAVAVLPSPSANPSTGPETPFVDRRSSDGASVGRERRQFTNSHADLSPEAAELATAIDAYKLRSRRRFINYEEMLSVLKSLGYSK